MIKLYFDNIGGSCVIIKDSHAQRHQRLDTVWVLHSWGTQVNELNQKIHLAQESNQICEISTQEFHHH